MRLRQLAIGAMLIAACATIVVGCIPDDVPSTLWVGFRIEADGERALPGVYVRAHGERLRGFAADHSEDVLMLARTDSPTSIERIKRTLGAGGVWMWECRTTGGRVDEPGYRWDEFALAVPR